MHAELLNSLKERFQFEDWVGINRLSEGFFLNHFFLDPFLGDGWSVHRVSSGPTPEGQQLVQSLWRQSDGDPEKLLRVDFLECNCRETAHRQLVGMLGQFESPMIERQLSSPVGDVSFAHPGDHIVAFARANLVLLIASALRCKPSQAYSACLRNTSGMAERSGDVLGVSFWATTHFI